MEKSEMLGSFVNGFGKTVASDVINAIYIAKGVFNIDFPFDFESRGTRGVDSLEIRKILFFSEIKTKRNHEEIFKTAKQLSKIDSNGLGWLAQYIMNGKTHLYEKEARKAVEIKNLLECQR
jgi:hypothetical protein